MRFLKAPTRHRPDEERGKSGGAAARADPLFERRLISLSQRLLTLPDKPQETAESTLRVLWHLANGEPLSVEAAQARALPALSEVAQATLDALIAQRLSGTPLAHLSGRQRFMGLEMLASPDALIPRRETELLGIAAVKLLDAMPGEPCAIDICTGSGNLALAIAYHAPHARVHAADLSPEAVELARRNGAHLHMDDEVLWRCGDLLEPFNEPRFLGSVDMIVCNPPYISSQKVDTLAQEISGHEPRLAFDGGPLGVRILQRLIRESPAYLKPGGWLAFEVGQGQGPAVLRRLHTGGGFAHARGITDAHGEMRVLMARR